MSQKIENQLNLALDATEAERQRSRSLNVGYDEEENEWELILKYSGSLEPVRELAVYVTELTGGYVIIQIKESRIEELAALPEVEFIEKPKNLYFQVENGRRVSCIDEVQAASSFFSAGQDIGKESGEGVLIGIVDSGIDYENPDFRNADGTTRIAALWDQTVETGLPPAGYNVGTEFTSQQINAALQTAGHEERFRLVPSRNCSRKWTRESGRTIQRCCTGSRTAYCEDGDTGRVWISKNDSVDAGSGLYYKESRGIKKAGSSQYQFWQYLWIS